MTLLFAHSGQEVKPNVRHLRGEKTPASCYLSAMRLRIKEIRLAKGWTVQQLADAVGLSKSYVSDLENGKRRASDYRLDKFAKAFNVSVYDLIDDGSLGADERKLLLDFAAMSDDSRRILLSTARAFRDAS